MAPRHISKQITNPYFASEHYKETKEYAAEVKISNFFGRIKNFILRRKND